MADHTQDHNFVVGKGEVSCGGGALWMEISWRGVWLGLPWSNFVVTRFLAHVPTATVHMYYDDDLSYILWGLLMHVFHTTLSFIICMS